MAAPLYTRANTCQEIDVKRQPLGTIVLAACLVLASATGGFAQEAAPAPDSGGTVLNLGMAGGYRLGEEDSYANGPVVRPSIGFDYSSEYFELFADLAVESSKKYGPAKANVPGGNFANLWFDMVRGGLRTHLGPFMLEAGRFPHYDVIDSPYSLFENSKGNSSLLLTLRYEGDFFFFQSRWLSLNYMGGMATPAWSTANGQATDGFPDRGANIRVYGFKLGDQMRFGFQDAAVYTGRNFDLEYFLNPIPAYFVQYAKTNLGRPWATGWNEKYNVGMFWDWTRPDGLSLNAQLMVADFNVKAIAPSTTSNPWKLAWTLGGRKETSIGSFGLYNAGATRYIYEPITMGSAKEMHVVAYGYTYYPDTRFDWSNQGNGDYQAIAIEDNAIGYKYGENNLAFQGDWMDRLFGLDLYAGLELRIAGSNSPANPWGNLASHPYGTKMLNESVLEKRILATFSVGKQIGDWRLSGTVTGGVALDALGLAAPAPSSDPDPLWTQPLWIYRPQEGVNKLILKLMFAATYSWKIR